MAHRLLVATLSLTLLALAGCSSDGGAHANIEIHDFAFEVNGSVAAGSEVHVQNHDDATHSVIADNAAFNTGNIAVGGDGHFDAPAKGTYAFHCALHPNMKGTLTVT